MEVGTAARRSGGGGWEGEGRVGGGGVAGWGAELGGELGEGSWGGELGSGGAFWGRERGGEGEDGAWVFMDMRTFLLFFPAAEMNICFVSHCWF